MRLRSLITACGIIAAALPAIAGPATHRWAVETSKPAATVCDAFQGETIHLEPTLVSYGVALSVSNAALTFYWQTNGMGSAWWSKPAEPLHSVTGRIRAIFAPTNDIGAAQYTFFIQASDTNASNYRAYGLIRLRSSPGFAPTAAPAPAYQWAAPADLQAVSNALASTIQALASASEASLASATGAVSVATATALASATGALASASEASLADVEFTGGWISTNWWDPILTPVYRQTSLSSISTNSYVIYDILNGESGFIDYLLSHSVVAGWAGPPTWTVTGTNAYVATNRLWAVAPGRVDLTGTADGLSRSVTVPICYGKIAQPTEAVSSLLPGSAAALASLPIIAMASNYLAATTEPLVARPNSWNTNETHRTNYAAVATWQSPVTWNTNCWLTNAPAVFAPCSIATGSGPTDTSRWGATLISPRVFVSASHVGPQVGTTKYWLTPSGSITSAVVSRAINLYSYNGLGTVDIVLGVLDRPMPTNMIAYVCTAAQFDAAFSGSATRFFSGAYVQAVAFSQHLDAALVELDAVNTVIASIRPPLLPAASSLSSLYHPAHPGDSSRPIFLLWGNKPVLLCVYYYATFGSSIPGHIADIDAAVQSEGETLTYINFQEAP